MEEIPKDYAIAVATIWVIILTGLVFTLINYFTKSNSFKLVSGIFLYLSVLSVFLVFFFGDEPIFEVVIPSVLTLINYVLINKKAEQIINQ